MSNLDCYTNIEVSNGMQEMKEGKTDDDDDSDFDDDSSDDDYIDEDLPSIQCNKAEMYANNNTKSLAKESNDKPPGRIYFGCCRSDDNIIYVFGGQIGGLTKREQLYGDLWRFKLTSMKWESINTQEDAIFCPGPTKRSKCSLTFYNNSLILFGGTGYNVRKHNELWIYDIKSEGWNIIRQSYKKPSKMHGHKVVAFKGHIILYGGTNLNGKTHYNDLWVLNLETYNWKLINVEPKSKPCKRTGFCFELFNDKIILCGGIETLKNRSEKTLRRLHDCYFIDANILVGHNTRNVYWNQINVNLPDITDVHSMTMHKTKWYVFGGYNRNRNTRRDFKNHIHMCHMIGDLFCQTKRHTSRYTDIITNHWCSGLHIPIDILNIMQNYIGLIVEKMETSVGISRGYIHTFIITKNKKKYLFLLDLFIESYMIELEQ